MTDEARTREEGVLHKVYYEEALPQGPTPYPYNFIPTWQKRYTPFIYFLLKKASLSHTYFRRYSSHFHVLLSKYTDTSIRGVYSKYNYQ